MPDFSRAGENDSMNPQGNKSSRYNIRFKVRHFLHQWIEPVFPVKRLWRSVRLYRRYFSDWSHYAALPGCETWSFLDSYPCLFDRTATTSVDSHYFYQDIWAFKTIYASGTSSHVDVGSRAILVGLLTTITKVTFVDIRPLIVDLEKYDSISGSILALPFCNSSIPSISCLHVAEHIGLGRYGDPLDPMGTKKATQELARVLVSGGRLYFSVPVGRPRVCFNAHRIHSPRQILDYFSDLELIQFSGVDDKGNFHPEADPDELAEADYACGLFCFTKRL